MIHVSPNAPRRMRSLYCLVDWDVPGGVEPFDVGRLQPSIIGCDASRCSRVGLPSVNTSHTNIPSRLVSLQLWDAEGRQAAPNTQLSDPSCHFPQNLRWTKTCRPRCHKHTSLLAHARCLSLPLNHLCVDLQMEKLLSLVVQSVRAVSCTTSRACHVPRQAPSCRRYMPSCLHLPCGRVEPCARPACSPCSLGSLTSVHEAGGVGSQAGCRSNPVSPAPALLAALHSVNSWSIGASCTSLCSDAP